MRVAGSYVDPRTAIDVRRRPGVLVRLVRLLGRLAALDRAADIAGTDDDRLYQDQRAGMSDYRFAVPDGTYRVDLSFAEMQLPEGRRPRVQRQHRGHHASCQPRRLRRGRRAVSSPWIGRSS